MIQTIRLNLNQTGIAAIAYASQADTKRQFDFLIYEDSDSYSIASSAQVSINGSKPDGYLFAYGESDKQADGGSIISKSGNKVTVYTTPQMTAVAGDTVCQIRITRNGQDLGVLSFTLRVSKTPLADEQGYSKSDIPPIIKLAEEQEAAAEKAAKEAAASEESVKKNAEAAAASEKNAKASEKNAKTSEENAKASEEAAAASAASIKGAEKKTAADVIAADASAAAAKESENAAKASENAAEAAKTTTRSYQVSAENSASAAAASESNAASSALAAAASEDEAAASASSASSSANAAAGSESAAAESEANAATSASAAAASETNAGDYADTAHGWADGKADPAGEWSSTNNSKYHSDNAHGWADGQADTDEEWSATNNAKYWAQAAQAAANLDFMENDRMGIGKPDTLTAEATNGTFTALGVAIKALINEGAEEFSATWLTDTAGNILTPDDRQLYRVVEDIESGASRLYYWNGSSYDMMAGGGGSDITIGDVSGATVTSFATTASLKWSDPADTTLDGTTLAKWAGTLVVRKAGSAPKDRKDGTVLLNSTERNAYASTAFEDTGLVYGTTYYYRFFPYTTGRVYTDGSSVSVTPARVPIAITPSVTGTYIYDGTEQEVSLLNFDDTKMDITGNTGTDAGEYTAIATPKEGYCWSDGSYAGLEIVWTIQKQSVAIPEMADGFTYDGTEKSALGAYDNALIDVSGTISSDEVGQYSFTLSLKDDDNYQWSDGTIADITHAWRIVAELLSVPSVQADLTYDGTEKSPTIGTYDHTKIQVVSGNTGTDAGEYHVIFHIIDPDSYLWADETAADKSVAWEIKKARLSVPTVTADLTYDGTEQTASVSTYDNTLISVTGISGTNAGIYTATKHLLNDNYQWTDETTEDKTEDWEIKKAQGACTLTPASVVLDPDNASDTIIISNETGAIQSVESSDTSVATAALNDHAIKVSSVNDTSGTATITVNIAASDNYKATSATVSVKCIFSGIWGAEWDGTATTAWSRTDDAAEFTDPVPYVAGAANYGSPFDDLQPWAGMVVEERTGGTMVKIPKFWYKITQNGAGMKIQISDGQQDGFSVSPAHMDRGDGKGERDAVYVGRYHCGETAYKSVSGQKPKASVTRSAARTAIADLGSDIWQMDFATRFTIWLLYIVEFANWNSQDKIGRGCSQTSASSNAVFNMGYTDSMPYHTGTTQSARTSYGGEQYRNIEGLWDNCYDWCDGAYYNSNGLNIILDPSKFSDSANGIAVGVPSSGYPSKFSVKDIENTFPVFIPTEASGSDATYSCDYWDFVASYPCLCVGGNYYQVLSHGLFYVGCSSTSSSSANHGCRLLELP